MFSFVLKIFNLFFTYLIYNNNIVGIVVSIIVFITHGILGKIGVNQKYKLVSIWYNADGTQLQYIAIYENAIFFAIEGNPFCNISFVIIKGVLPINPFNSKSIKTYTIDISIAIFVLSLSYTLLIDLYRIYSFATKATPNIH